MKHKLLLVDDEAANLRALERLLRDDFDVLTAESGSEGLELLTQNDVALIISDQRMPGMSGIEFLKQAAQLRHRTVRIILTGYTDIGDVVEAINSGVIYKYLAKPWANTDLIQTVQRAVEHYQTTKGQHLLAQENDRLESRMQVTVRGFVKAIRELVALKSSHLAEHSRRTSEYAALIAEELGMGSRETEELHFACLMHEAPNMRLPFEMNITKEALTPDQYRATCANYENGVAMIAHVPDLEEVAAIIRYQHEHFDGTGFFTGLAGDAIPLASRILAVANAFDEISCGPRSALMRPDHQAYEWLRAHSGKQFDPNVIDAFLRTGLNGLTGQPNVIRPVGIMQPVETMSY